VKFVLVRLEISTLGERPATAVKIAVESLGRVMDIHVCPNIAALGEPFATLFACKWLLASVSTLVSLVWLASYQC
jgi:hypothetical protein